MPILRILNVEQDRVWREMIIILQTLIFINKSTGKAPGVHQLKPQLHIH